MALFSHVMCTVLLFRVSNIAFSTTQQHVFLSSNNPTPCYNSTVDLICHYPDVMKMVNGQHRYSVTTASWRINGKLHFAAEDALRNINRTASRLSMRIDPASFGGDPVTFTCYLQLNGGGEDNASTVVDPNDTPNSPVITTVNNSNSTSISLNWAHDKTCFESVPLEYHVVVNTDTQPIITDQLTAKIGGVISGTPYTFSVMAVPNSAQRRRSEPDTESVTAGYPATRASTPHQCFDRHFLLTCHHEYETTVLHVWFMDGIPVEHDQKEFAINHGDGSLTLMDVSQSRYAERETFFQCCVNLTSGPQVCGEHYIFDPLEQPEAPTVITVRTEQTSISLSWEVSKTCFESVDFTVNISWRSASGNGQVTNVSGNRYDITSLTPGVSYHITLVAIGDGIQSDPMSISRSTLPSDADTLPVGAVVGIVISALVILTIVIVVAVAGFAICWNKKDSGTLNLKTDQGQRTMQGLTYVTVDHSQQRPINVPNENLDVQYTGVKFNTKAPTV